MNRFFSIAKQFFIWSAFTVGVFTSIGMIYMQFGEKGIPKQAPATEAPNQAQVHRFDIELACPFSAEIESGVWQRTEEIFNAYSAKKTAVYGENKNTYLQFIGTRRTTRADPPATLFSKDECMATDAGSEVTADGLIINLQKVECQSKPDETPKTSPGTHRLYGTIHGHWVAIGAGIFATNVETIHRYRPQLIQILKTVKHQCAIDFSPLPTGETAVQASSAAEQEAIEKASQAAKVAAAVK